LASDFCGFSDIVIWLGSEGALKRVSIAGCKQGNPGLAPSSKAQAEAGPLMSMVRRVNMRLFP
jgi:hypothetical protein